MSQDPAQMNLSEQSQPEGEGGSLFFQIFASMAAGVLLGVFLGSQERVLGLPSKSLLQFCAMTSKLVLQLLAALATPLILVAVSHVLMTSDIKGRQAGRLVWLLITNTLMAILIGLMLGSLRVLWPWPSTAVGESNGLENVDLGAPVSGEVLTAAICASLAAIAVVAMSEIARRSEASS